MWTQVKHGTRISGKKDILTKGYNGLCKGKQSLLSGGVQYW